MTISVCVTPCNNVSDRFDPEENLWTMMPSMTKVTPHPPPPAHNYLPSAPVSSRSGAAVGEDVRLGRPQRALHLRQCGGVRHSDGMLGGNRSHAFKALQTWGRLHVKITQNKQSTNVDRWRPWVGRFTRVEVTTAPPFFALSSASTLSPASK